MRTALARAHSPERKAGRVTTTRPTLKLDCTGTTEDSLLARRVQQLVSRFGLPEMRARLIATLAFGEVTE